jgi:hypothetical protein
MNSPSRLTGTPKIGILNDLHPAANGIRGPMYATQDKELKNAAQDKQLKYTERMAQNQGKTVVPMCVKRSPREGAVPQFCAVP